MKFFLKFFFYLPIIIFFAAGCATKEIVKVKEETKVEEVEKIPEEEVFEIKPVIKKEAFAILFPANAKIENVTVDKKKKIININLSKEFSYVPFRNETVEMLYDQLGEELRNEYSDFKLQINAFRVRGIFKPMKS